MRSTTTQYLLIYSRSFYQTDFLNRIRKQHNVVKQIFMRSSLDKQEFKVSVLLMSSEFQFENILSNRSVVK